MSLPADVLLLVRADKAIAAALALVILHLLVDAEVGAFEPAGGDVEDELALGLLLQERDGVAGAGRRRLHLGAERDGRQRGVGAGELIALHARVFLAGTERRLE